MEEEEVLICQCGSVDHQLTFFCDKEDNIVYCHIHLSNYKTFFKRLICGIKYIFGYKTKYGDFDSFIFKHQHVEKLIKIAELLKK